MRASLKELLAKLVQFNVWKLAGTCTGNTSSITVPDSAQEVMVVLNPATTTFTGIAQVADLATVWNIGGYYLASNDIGIVNLNVFNNNRSFQVRNCKYGSGDYKTTVPFKVYYR